MVSTVSCVNCATVRPAREGRCRCGWYASVPVQEGDLYTRVELDEQRKKVAELVIAKLKRIATLIYSAERWYWRTDYNNNWAPGTHEAYTAVLGRVKDIQFELLEQKESWL